MFVEMMSAKYVSGGGILCRDIIGSLGCDSCMYAKQKCQWDKVGFEKMKSCNFKGNDFSLLGLFDGVV